MEVRQLLTTFFLRVARGIGLQDLRLLASGFFAWGKEASKQKDKTKEKTQKKLNETKIDNYI